MERRNTMDQFLYDLHVHTAETSACARSMGADMAEFYKREGYTGFVVTDHFFNGNTTVRDESLSWEERVARFCLGYEHAKEKGDEIGIDVFFGWEYSYHGTDFVTLGLDRAWLLAHPDVHRMDIPAYADLVHADGGFLIHAHPFLQASYINCIRLYPKYEDAVEVINGGKPQDVNRQALDYARFYDKTETGGSDAHSVETKNLSGVVLPGKIHSTAELAPQLAKREHTIYKKVRI